MKRFALLLALLLTVTVSDSRFSTAFAQVLPDFNIQIASEPQAMYAFNLVAKAHDNAVVSSTTHNFSAPLPTSSSLKTLIYLPFAVRTSLGNIYYVATTGNDSTGDGTIARPWRTIAKGVRILMPGDTLYVKSGTYLQTSTLRISHSGTAEARITISTAPGEPTLAVVSGDVNANGTTDPTDTPANNRWGKLVGIFGNNITFQNMEVAYSGGRGIESDGANNIIAVNNVHHTWGEGIYVNGASNLVGDNTVWRAADSNYCGGTGGNRKCNGDWSGGIAWGSTDSPTPPGHSPNIIIRQNTVFNVSGEGILCMQTEGGIVEENVVYDNWGLGIYLDQCSYTTIQRNLVYYTGDTNWWRGTDSSGNTIRPASGVLLSNEGINGFSVVAHDNKVINNVIVGSGQGVDFWHGYVTGSALINDVIANNTLVIDQGTGSIGIILDAGPHSNTRIVNNLVLQSSGAIADTGSTTGLKFDHNLWSRTPPANVSSPTDVIGNPLLIEPNHLRSPGGVVPDWYKLSAESPALEKGIALSQVIDDFWGTLRGASPDIGAHEYVP